MFFVFNSPSSSQAGCRRFDPGLPLQKHPGYKRYRRGREKWPICFYADCVKRCQLIQMPISNPEVIEACDQSD
jgi:hypothetical protein